MSNTHSKPKFSDLGLPSPVVELLNSQRFFEPTPIQEQAIPLANDDRDVIGIAQTGTGKTLAFGVPILCQLKENQMALVLAPTRELAIQIQDTLFKLRLKTALLIGGAPMDKQLKQLRSGPQVIVATPGRLIDHMQQGTASLRKIQIAVLDEADRMLDMGFAPAIKRILQQVPHDRQMLMFSATMPESITELTREYMRDPVRIEVSPAGTSAELVEQEAWVVRHDDKRLVLSALLKNTKGPALVFARTRHGARKLALALREMGHTAAEIHSDRSLAQRREALEGFKKGQYKVLVATDIAARGIDVKNIEVVVNFELPDHLDDYVHRIGRTGRAGASGRAIALITGGQRKLIERLEKICGAKITIGQPHVPIESVIPDAVEPEPVAAVRTKTTFQRRETEKPVYERPRAARPEPQPAEPKKKPSRFRSESTEPAKKRAPKSARPAWTKPGTTPAKPKKFWSELEVGKKPAGKSGPKSKKKGAVAPKFDGRPGSARPFYATTKKKRKR